MSSKRYVRLFRNGSNQALRIPREYEFDTNEAILRKEGNSLIIEPVPQTSLATLLRSWDTQQEQIPSIEDSPIEPEDIF